MNTATISAVSAELAEVLRRRVGPASVIREHEPLARRTTLRVGGPADLWVEPATESDLAQMLEVARAYGWPWMVIGRGSNLLVRDGGVRGMVISLGAPVFSEIVLRGDRDQLVCGAGARLRAVAVEAKKNGLAGFEFMEGIPGNVGGGLRMNAGAMGSAMFQVVESVRMMDASGQVLERPAAAIPVEYRHCPLLRAEIALGAVFSGRPANKETIEARMNECSRKRWSSQPAAPSAGCIFKNTAHVPTGRLVEELGLKGTRRGGALISEVHGNFIVNEGEATARDILELIQLVREQARLQRGLELETEVQIIGED